MKTLKLCLTITTASAVSLLSACAGMPEQTAQSTRSKECKVVLVDSASQVISGYNSDLHKRPYEAQTQTEQAEANAGIDKAIQRQPIVRGRTPGQMNNLVDARRDC